MDPIIGRRPPIPKEPGVPEPSFRGRGSRRRNLSEGGRSGRLLRPLWGLAMTRPCHSGEATAAEGISQGAPVPGDRFVPLVRAVTPVEGDCFSSLRGLAMTGSPRALLFPDLVIPDPPPGGIRDLPGGSPARGCSRGIPACAGMTGCCAVTTGWCGRNGGGRTYRTPRHREERSDEAIPRSKPPPGPVSSQATEWKRHGP